MPDDIQYFIGKRKQASKQTYKSTGPDSVMVRAFASEAGGAGSNPGHIIPKTLKIVPVADQWNYRGTLDFLVYRLRAENVDTLVTNDISISQLGIEIFRSEK